MISLNPSPVPTFLKNKRHEDRAFLDTFHNKFCIICSFHGCDPAHIKSRGAGGGDEWWNVMALCHTHHQQQHTMPWREFAELYPEVMKSLTGLGWSFLPSGKITRIK